MRRGYRSTFDRSRGRGGRGGRGRGAQYHQPGFQNPSGMRYGETHCPYSWGRTDPNPGAHVGYISSCDEGAGKDDSVAESSGSTLLRRSFDGSVDETGTGTRGESPGATSHSTLRDWYYDNEIESAVDRELSGDSAVHDWTSVGKTESRESSGERMRSWAFGGSAVTRMKPRGVDSQGWEPSDVTKDKGKETPSEDVGGWASDTTLAVAADESREQREAAVLGKRKEPPGDQDVRQGDARFGDKQPRLQSERASEEDAEGKRREWMGERSRGEAAEGSSEKPEGGRRDDDSETVGKERGAQQKKPRVLL